jgi:hypothetical protein
MASTKRKPAQGQFQGGSFGNYPIINTVVNNTTTAIAVPETALQITMIAHTAAGSVIVTNTSGGSAIGGTITLPVDVPITIDCAGMFVANLGAAATTPAYFKITTTSTVSSWFNCTTASGTGGGA